MSTRKIFDIVPNLILDVKVPVMHRILNIAKTKTHKNYTYKKVV